MKKIVNYYTYSFLNCETIICGYSLNLPHNVQLHIIIGCKYKQTNHYILDPNMVVYYLEIKSSIDKILNITIPKIASHHCILKYITLLVLNGPLLPTQRNVNFKSVFCWIIKLKFTVICTNYGLCSYICCVIFISMCCILVV